MIRDPAQACPGEMALQSIEDRIQIQDVIHRWCRAIDRLDFDGISACFHEDAHDDHVFYKGDIPGLIDCLKARHKAISFSMHAVSNVLIEFGSSGEAVVESYVQVVQRRPLGSGRASDVRADGIATACDSNVSEVFCRYVDRFEKRNGSWKIAERILLIDSAREYDDREPVHRLPPEGSVNRGRRDPSDTVYRERARFGIDRR